MRKLRRLFSFPVLVILFVAGLSLLGKTFTSAKTNDKPAVFYKDDYRIEVALPEGPAKALAENPFTLTLKDRDGSLVSGAKIGMLLSMPDMFCGTSSAVLEETSPGVYRGSGVPLMTGASAADVSIETGNQSIAVRYLFTAVH